MSYDPRTGREFWRVRYSSHSGAAMPLFGHGLVYINTGFGAADLLAVRPDGEGDVTGDARRLGREEEHRQQALAGAGRRPDLQRR